MDEALTELIAAIQAGTHIDDAWLSRLLRRHNRRTHDATRRVAKRRLLPYYLAVRRRDPARWEAWGLSEADEATLLRVLRMKPRRTASGVATITVITKPWPCSGTCVFCPADVRMPKSYLASEPACQRAERNFFDPYLQVRSRLAALTEMGHHTDKIELIVLGGTWSDYPQDYQVWFMRELFRALNDAGGTIEGGDGPETRDARYREAGHTFDEEELASRTASLQEKVTAGELTYNDAIRQILRRDEWRGSASWQHATIEELEREHVRNEDAAHRVVGLTIETRPDLITDESARMMRRLGCTKVQMGVQSLDNRILELNGRRCDTDAIASAFSVLRLQGFKIQIHFMANLLGATPATDVEDFSRLVTDERFLPDEVKLYPCSLVESAALTKHFEDGSWRPYDEDELVGLLAQDLMLTPAYTRISRMIRDISSQDILCGNKKTNLRQMVEAMIQGADVAEIRFREVAGQDVDPSMLSLTCLPYETTVSSERFLQWGTPEGRIAAFLRLSLPHGRDVAMIREVHVYGRVAALSRSEAGGAQHIGLGSGLVREACRIAGEAGYGSIDVISSVGTRNYYRSLGFFDAGLYQRRSL